MEECSSEPRAEATRMADDGPIKRAYVKLCASKWPSAEKGPDDQLDQWAITIRYEDENSRSGAPH
jgi:hypothetical protein